MPWKIIKRPCKKSDGKTGKYAIVKIKRGGGTEQSSCHTSKKKAQGGVRARHANEGKMKITKRKLKQLIREELEAVINGKTITEVGAREIRGKYSPILAGGTVINKSSGKSEYMFRSDLRSWNWNWNGLDKREAQKILLDMDDDQDFSSEQV